MRPNRRQRALTNLVAILCEAVVEADHDVVVGVRFADDHGIELFLQPPAGTSCVEALLGFEAPPTWDAIGVAAIGRATALDGGRAADDRRTGPDGPLAVGPVVVGFLLSRSGLAFSATGPPGGPFRPVHGPVSGRVADACARALGRPTAPTDRPPVCWWARRWLEALAARAAAGRSAGTWAELADAFPGGPGAVDRRDAVELSRSGRFLALAHPWSTLRVRCARGEDRLGPVPAPLASWMDDAMFARWTCDGPPPLPVLAQEVTAGLAPVVARQLGWVLRSWGIALPGGAG